MGLKSWNILRVIKPVAAGVALAYLATALVDGPPPVNFQPENPYSAKQAEIVASHAELVIEKNIMKLGSLLSVQGDEVVKPDDAIANELELFFAPGSDSSPFVKGDVMKFPES